MVKGKVIRVTGQWNTVLLENGNKIETRIIGKFRLNGMKLTNPVAVGDRVMIELEPRQDNRGLIKEILPRENYIVRQSPRKKHDLHLLAANVDQSVLISTIVSPTLKLGFIDRFLLMMEPHDIPAFIIFNKADLYGEDEMMMYHGLKYMYEAIGYNVLLSSAVTGQGIDEIKEVLKGKITFLGGQSGVGKSSLINLVHPHLELRTEELSDYTGKGTHTTTFAEMFSLENGGYVIDTPGIKTLSFNNLEVMDVAHNFREFFKVSPGCKFSDCSHRNEPGCAVKEAIEEGTISELRYTNYLQILDEIEDQNYWERHKDM